ncbi:NERD domain-containing protein [Paenisporosarcina cavernae]|uniref:NERD domain-containing protein n=2 Tax=Paenisporosarcina cavernae TaxID=2320858 RepID=A0A385YTW7_9BACL|nr:NERD domain-containing protein [Paenisporosarcina cavernae]
MNLARFTPDFPINLFHDILLKSYSFFQIDHLILTKHYALIIESKNLKFQIEITRNPDQLIQYDELGNSKVMDSPLQQLEKNCEWMRGWLLNKGIDLPVFGIFAVSNVNCKIVTKQEEPTIVRASFLQKKILELPRSTEFIDENTLAKLKKSILNEHMEFDQHNFLKNFDVDVKELLPGMWCDVCKKLTVSKIGFKFMCTCGNENPSSFMQAVNDYFLLMKNEMSNKECRTFLKIESAKVTYRKLQQSGLQIQGRGRNTLYLNKRSPAKN